MLLKTKGVKFGQCGPIFPSTFPALRQQQTVLHNSSVRLKNAVQASAPQHWNAGIPQDSQASSIKRSAPDRLARAPRASQEPRASSRPREGAEEPAG